MPNLTVNLAVRFQGSWKVDTDVIKYADTPQIGKQNYQAICDVFEQPQNKLTIQNLPSSVKLTYERGQYGMDDVRISFDAGVAHGQSYIERLKAKGGIPFVRKSETLEAFVSRAVKRAVELAEVLEAQ